MILVLMGVSGSGKSTRGKRFAQELAWPFYEGDDFHPEANIEKMKKGIPLPDEVRTSWLAVLADLIAKHDQNKQSAIVTCSALKQRYREILAAGACDLHFVYLKGSCDLIRKRLVSRTEHFFKTKTAEEPVRDPGRAGERTGHRRRSIAESDCERDQSSAGFINMRGKKPKKATRPWFLYILKCSDGTLYTGITNNLQKRVERHNSGKASRYTRNRLPVVLLYRERCLNRTSALKKEYRTKSLSREKKEEYIKRKLPDSR